MVQDIIAQNISSKIIFRETLLRLFNSFKKYQQFISVQGKLLYKNIFFMLSGSKPTFKVLSATFKSIN
ncbi:hypothetical protein BC008_26310 [Mastigocoleus testarum BC008]|uniref:Uncharacterized protein n=1 Tax=Mastigocoleus testarum BC008 TaxID=371196 RepID=A0A0V7ZQN1_9CYAN|nr:hypothetical protein BC008_25785 [Mastigocoleus testarum BC008]KST66706.1 hypothetical protein BC008_26310 [Mastigocoleus testarum BC008]